MISLAKNSEGGRPLNIKVTKHGYVTAIVAALELGKPRIFDAADREVVVAFKKKNWPLAIAPMGWSGTRAMRVGQAQKDDVPIPKEDTITALASPCTLRGWILKHFGLTWGLLGSPGYRSIASTGKWVMSPEIANGPMIKNNRTIGVHVS